MAAGVESGRWTSRVAIVAYGVGLIALGDLSHLWRGAGYLVVPAVAALPGWLLALPPLPGEPRSGQWWRVRRVAGLVGFQLLLGRDAVTHDAVTGVSFALVLAVSTWVGARGAASGTRG